MFRRNIFTMKTLFFYAIFAIFSVGSSRKHYDVEAEAMRLYGEDLNSVLLRFRKSTDYMNILNDKVTAHSENFAHLMKMVLYYYQQEQASKIAELLGVADPVYAETLRSMFNPSGRGPVSARSLRQEADDETMTPVMQLDHYPKLHQTMAVRDINYFKNLGFEFAGRCIHTIIKHMGPDDTPVRSTRLPLDGYFHQKSSTSTHHDHDHQVKPSIDSDVTVPEGPGDVPGVTPIVNSLRFPHRNKITA